MRRNKNIIAYILLATMAVSATSCTKDFVKTNIDPIGKGKVEANQLLAPALVNVMSANLVRNRNFNNELMQVTVDMSDSEGKVFRYDIRRTWADMTWNAWYLALTDLRDMYEIASTPEKLNSSYKGISLITQAWVYSLLTDTYGDVPYSEANQGKKKILEPKFDQQKDIYTDLFAKLEEANTLLTENTAIVATSDPVYNGDVQKWRRFGNSLYLRLLLRVSAKSEVSAGVIAKIKEVVDTNPAAYPVMEDNTHTAAIKWNGTNSTTTVYSSPLMIRVRPVDFRGTSLGAFFLNNLVTYADPRIQSQYGANNINRFGIKAGTDGFVGAPSGFATGSQYNAAAFARFYSDAETVSGAQPLTLQTDKSTGILMNAAEVDFVRAEAAAKGWITSGTAAYYYKKGAANAINYWIPSIMNNGGGTEVDTYLADGDIQWNDALPLYSTQPGGESKMELIHKQKYFAMFMIDFQQWFEYRRTGYPHLTIGAGVLNNGKMPSRLNYPVITQSTNPSNYKQVVASQGADDISTLVWWQKP